MCQLTEFHFLEFHVLLIELEDFCEGAATKVQERKRSYPEPHGYPIS